MSATMSDDGADEPEAGSIVSMTDSPSSGIADKNAYRALLPEGYMPIEVVRPPLTDQA